MKTYRRRIMAITSLAAIVIGTTSALNAQTLETRANVPFAFTAGTTTLPAGTYNLTTLPGHTDAFMIRSLLHGVIILSQPSRYKPQGRRAGSRVRPLRRSVLPSGDSTS